MLIFLVTNSPTFDKIYLVDGHGRDHQADKSEK
jgi:hypothetical protein